LWLLVQLDICRFDHRCISCDLSAAANTKTGPLRCVGTAIHVGRQVGTSEARIVGRDGKLYAHATTTCAIFESPLPAA
jgi:hypothetical protein